MQIMQMPKDDGYRTAQRTVTIAVDIGRYHFIDANGWHHEWDTRTPREWWQKQLWLKEGGYTQDESIDDNHDSESGREWHTSL